MEILVVLGLIVIVGGLYIMMFTKRFSVGLIVAIAGAILIYAGKSIKSNEPSPKMEIIIDGQKCKLIKE